MVQICHLPIRYLLSKVTTFADDTRGGKKRILALDGGGIRGVFTIEILGRMEQLLREHFGRPQMVLADHSDLIAGTSTGGIIGSFLSWGEPVDSVRKLYEENTGAMFCKAPWWKLRGGLFDAKNLSVFLREFFVETDGSLSVMGTQRLKTIMLLVMRNASTGSAWPVTNHAGAKYNTRQ
jgi:predicted acylesterase/phospholipase RssA